MNWIKELHIAAQTNQRVTVRLYTGENITGVAEVCNNPKHAKIRTSEGPVWVPYEDIEHVSRVINMFQK